MLFCILFISFFGSDRGEYSLADDIAAWKLLQKITMCE